MRSKIGSLESYGTDEAAVAAVAAALREYAAAAALRLREAVRLHEALGRVLAARFTGKAVNARVVPLFRAEAGLPEGEAGGWVHVQWRREYGRGFVRVWGVAGAKEYGEAVDLEVGAESELVAYPGVEAFEAADVRNGGNARKALGEVEAWQVEGKAEEEAREMVELARGWVDWHAGVEGSVNEYERRGMLKGLAGVR
jgi:hypothetical protein